MDVYMAKFNNNNKKRNFWQKAIEKIYDSTSTGVELLKCYFTFHLI